MPFMNTVNNRTIYKLILHEGGEFGAVFITFDDVVDFIHTTPQMNGSADKPNPKHNIILVRDMPQPTVLTLSKGQAVEVQNAWEQYLTGSHHEALES